MFVYQDFDERNISKKKVLDLIKLHNDKIVPELMKKKAYYNGKQAINNRKDKRDGQPNEKVICNHAKDIADTATGYFMGNPITYKNTADTEGNSLEELVTAFNEANTDDTDSDNALNMSIYGVAYEYVYPGFESTKLKTKSLNPEHTFLVKDDTIEEADLFAVYYYSRINKETKKECYHITLFTWNLKYEFEVDKSLQDSNETLNDGEEHFCNEIPVICYLNNKDEMGDFEQQIGLIDAYNTLMSDRVNDKIQFVNSLLLLYGANIGDDESSVKEAMEVLRQEGILEMPLDAKGEYISRTLDEAGAETLRKSLKQDIYTFSHVPNLTDENFVGNSSGVAMEFKLLGLEMLTKIKERNYKSTLRKRIRIFCHRLGLLSLQADANSIMPEFSRGLPKNLVELAQVVNNLKGNVSLRTLLKLLPFVEDPDNEIDRLDAETKESIQNQQKLFGNHVNEPPEDNVYEES